MSMLQRILVVFAILSPLMAGLFVVHVHQDGVQLGYELMKEENDWLRNRKTLKRLQAELEAESTPERLKAMANQLGLKQPDSSQIVGAVYPEGETDVD